jgi:hypothetical protein
MKNNLIPFSLTAVIAFFLLMISLNFATAQEGWSLPVQITDDINNNHRNPDLLRGSGNVWLTYERYSDSLSTAIDLLYYLASDYPVTILDDELIHYTNPRFFYDYYFYQSDTAFLIFYESNQNGNKDLNYVKYLNNGEILGPDPFFQTEGDDHSLEFALYNPRISWISEGKLMLSEFTVQNENFSFADPVVVDSGNCLSPKFVESWGLYYIKRTDSTSAIYKTEQYGSFDKEVIYDEGYAKNLNKDGLGWDLLTWTGMDYSDSLWYLYSLEYWWGMGEYNAYFLPKETPYDPAICSFQIGVKSVADDLGYYLSFPYDSLGFEEILMNPDMSSNFINFSNSETINRNPNSFFGENAGYSCFFAYMIWETLVNDKWQLYYSKSLMCVGGVDENDAGQSFIGINPNPFTEKININYSLDQGANVRIDILDVVGKPVFNLLDEFQAQGLHKLNWTTGNNLKKGAYFIRLQNGQRTYVQKIIKAD